MRHYELSETPDPDELCMVCGKLTCECPLETHEETNQERISATCDWFDELERRWKNEPLP